MASLTRRSWLAPLLALTFVLSTIVSLWATAPSAEAAKKKDTNEGQNGLVNAPFMIGYVDFNGGGEGVIYVVNPLSRDFDLDVLLFLYDSEGNPQDCGVINLIRNDTAAVLVSGADFASFALVVIKSDDDFLDGDGGDNERKGVVAYIRHTDGGADGLTIGSAQAVPISLQGRMRDQLRADFDEDVFGFDCTTNVLEAKPGKKGGRETPKLRVKR